MQTEPSKSKALNGELHRLVQADANRFETWGASQTGTGRRQRVAILHFMLGDSWYGVRTEHVKQVVSKPTVHPIPTAPTHVLGVANLGGQVVPIMDLRKFLEIPAATTPMLPMMMSPREVGEERMVVVEAAEMMCAFPVDLVRQVIEVFDDDIRDPAISVGRVRQHAFGEVDHQGRVLTLLDLPAIIEAART